MPRLIHLNGPAGIGKSTLARRFADDHPGTLCLDVDRLHELVGGAQDPTVDAHDRFSEVSHMLRPLALDMATAYLAGGHDVVLPQFLGLVPEIERFEAAAAAGGAHFVEVVLTDARDSALARFHARSVEDPWHDRVREVVARAGGDELLGAMYDALPGVLAARPSAVVVPSPPGDEDGTYAALLAALAPSAGLPDAPVPVASLAVAPDHGSRPRLVHLNGAPGIGKSTLARRFADDHPFTLNLDVDRLRSFVGGWDTRFAETGELIRPVALAMITSWLAHGHDVVFPQLLARVSEIEKFAAAVDAGGGDFVEVMLSDTTDDPRASSLERFARRGETDADPWHAHVQEIVAASGGEDYLGETFDRLASVLAARSSYVVVGSAAGDVDATYSALLAALAPHG